MLKIFIIPVLIFAIITIVFSIYLQTDDLSGCSIKPSENSNCQAVDAIVVVSGGDTNARVNEGIKLYKNGWANKIIFSGAAQDKSGPSNAAAMKTVALQAGVPDLNIYLDEYSETTKQNALNSQTIFIEHNIKSVILVTSGYHQRRAGLEFIKRTKNVVIENHPVYNDKDWSFWWWLTPYGWWFATTEFIKIIIFYITGIWS